jgi:hypothetical protein
MIPNSVRKFSGPRTLTENLIRIELKSKVEQDGTPAKGIIIALEICHRFDCWNQLSDPFHLGNRDPLPHMLESVRIREAAVDELALPQRLAHATILRV